MYLKKAILFFSLAISSFSQELENLLDNLNDYSDKTNLNIDYEKITIYAQKHFEILARYIIIFDEVQKCPNARFPPVYACGRDATGSQILHRNKKSEQSGRSKTVHHIFVQKGFQQD